MPRVVIVIVKKILQYIGMRFGKDKRAYKQIKNFNNESNDS